MSEEAFDKTPAFGEAPSSDPALSSPPEWLLDRELDVAAEVYGPEPLSLHTPVDQLSDAELLQRFINVNSFDLRFE